MTSKKLLSCILAAAMAVTTVPIVTAAADTATMTLTQESGSESGQLTITLTIDLKTPSAENFDYTAPTELGYSGSDITATVAAKSNVTGMGDITVHYYSDADRETEVTETKNVGTYYVGITLAEGTHYAASSSVIYDDSWTFEITKSTPSAPAAPTATSDNITKNSITLTEVTGCEYSKDGTHWQDSPTFSGFDPQTEYTLYQRLKETANTNPSPASSAKFSTTADTYGMTITLTIGNLNVKIGNHKNGTLKLKDKADNTDLTKVSSGDLITVKATPDSGYRLSSLTYTANGASQSVTIPANGSDYEFTMPDKDVTVNAVFTKIGGGSVDYETVTDGGITYHVYSDHAEATEADTAIETAVIKDKVDGKNVTVIAENAFNSCKSLTAVTIPATVKTIEANAFWGCTSLESLTIPKTVTKIDKNAFSHCTAFKTIYGYTGSAAETFAKTNNIEFVALDAQSEETLGIAKAPTVDEKGVVSWSPVENAVKYRIVKEYGGKTYFGKETTETSYQQNNTNVLDEHKIYIRSYDADGNYTNGEVLTVPAKVGIAKAPTVDSDGVITWKPVQNAVTYKIVKEYNGKTFTGKETMELSYQQNNVPIVEYKVYIRAFGGDGSYTNGEVRTVPEKAKRLGTAKAPTVDNDGVVSWKSVTNASKYVVVKVVDGEKYYGKSTTETSYKFANKPRKDYQVYVLTYDETGNYTVGQEAEVELPLGYVDDVTVDAKGNVTWTAARNAVKYKVGKTVNGKTYYTGELTTNSTTIKVPKSNYKVFVVAFDKDGNKTWGTKADVKVK